MVQARDFSHYYGDVAKAQKPSVIKKYYKYYGIPGIGNLAGGLPNPGFFPVDGLEFKAAAPDRFLHDNSESTHLSIPRQSNQEPAYKVDINSGFQYGQVQGYPALLNWVKGLVAQLYPDVPYEGGPDVAMSYGNTDALNKTVKVFSNEWCAERDPVDQRGGIFVEEFTYTSAFQNFEPRGLNCVPVECDGLGMMAEGPRGLRHILGNWDYSQGRRPHLMYTIPTGQNPMGTVMSAERKQEIYKICQEFDVIIIEDDPYWCLQFDVNHDDYLGTLVKSYLSMDVDGRVVRLDTFSKIVAPGCRLGWVTAQPSILGKINLLTEGDLQGPSQIVQTLLAQIITGGSIDNKAWGNEGFIQWCQGLSKAYKQRRDLMCDALDEGKSIMVQTDRVQVYEFIRPEGGMFVWLHVRFSTHPLAESFSVKDLSEALWLHWVSDPHRVIVTKGSMYGGSENIRETKGYEHFRLCFAAVEFDQVLGLTKRFKDGVETFWAASADKIQALAEEAAQVG